MTKPLTTTRLDKIDVNPVVNRVNQSTADDWNEDKLAINNHAELLHVESRNVNLDESLSHTITFDNVYPDTEYCFIKLTVYRVEISGEYTNLPIKNLNRYVDRFSFDTYTSENLKIDYFIMQRQLP